MVGVNKWTGIGNMTADPEIKQGQDEKRDRCTFSIGINRGKDQKATFIDIVTWGDLANRVAEWGAKGRLVYVEGAIDVYQFENDEGEKRRIYRVNAWGVSFLDRRDRDDDEEEAPRRRSSSSGRRSRDDDDDRPARRRPTESANDYDDLPF